MKSTFRLIIPFLVLVLLVVVSPAALAQGHWEDWEDHHHEKDPEDYTTTPLIMPTIEDYAPMPAPESETDGKTVTEAPLGVNSYFEVSEKVKVFSLTPSYRFSKSLAVKVRLPYVLEHTRTFSDGSVSAKGLGDIALDGEFTHRIPRANQVFRLQATVKLPTGNNENREGNDHLVPLGTGSVDLMARALFTHSTPITGLLASAIYRLNTSGSDVTSQDTSFNPVQTTAQNTTNGNEFVGSVFGRQMVGSGLWINLGASLIFTGNGERTSQTTANNSIISESSNKLTQKSTLIDIYPGVSYKLGPITPYLGARIPLSTSYDNASWKEERDTVFIFQLTYRPLAIMD